MRFPALQFTWVLGFLLATLTGCVVPVGEYDGGGPGYIGGYYEPYGYEYGAWGPGYWVGPPRGGDRRSASGAHRTFRAAASHRATPSIPTRSRKH